MVKQVLMMALVCMGISVIAEPKAPKKPKAKARIDLSSKDAKMVPVKNEKGIIVINAPWVKDEEKKAMYVFSQGKDLSPTEWSEYEVSFTPQADGNVRVNLMSNYYFDKDESGKRKMMPLWVLWDDVVVEGADIVNGNFEEEKKNGMPQGWYTKKENYIKKDGKKCVKAWHNSRAVQNIKVKKGQKVTIKAKAKSAE